ncbi:GIY-YIG nuclease family protein [Patescibacteria group bacterium]|nr:GIY-YIG nuclease family protein [Patescibacteria group bacterium]
MEYVYVLQSEQDKKFYVGLTNNLRKRFSEHNAGLVFSTRKRVPLTLVYYEACVHRSDARKREVYLKTAWGKRYIKNRLRNYLFNIISRGK